MKKIVMLVLMAAAAAGCEGRMDNKEFMDECDACRARGYVCADILNTFSGVRRGVQCNQEPDKGKANLQAMLQIATEPLDARDERGRRRGLDNRLKPMTMEERADQTAKKVDKELAGKEQALARTSCDKCESCFKRNAVGDPKCRHCIGCDMMGRGNK